MMQFIRDPLSAVPATPDDISARWSRELTPVHRRSRLLLPVPDLTIGTMQKRGNALKQELPG